MLIFIGVIMALAMVGMIVCAKKQQTYPRAQPVAIALLVVVVFCGVMILKVTGVIGDGGRTALVAKEMTFSKAKAFVLGKHLAKTMAGAKVLVIAERDMDKSERHIEILKSLKEGLGASVSEIVVDSLKIPLPEGVPEGTRVMMPYAEMMAAEYFDSLIDAHPDCNLVISMLPLPANAAEMKFWEKEDDVRPKLAFLSGSIHPLEQIIRNGYIIAMVSYCPGIGYDDADAPSDPQEAFDKRYLLVTPENIDMLAAKYENMFVN